MQKNLISNTVKIDIKNTPVSLPFLCCDAHPSRVHLGHEAEGFSLSQKD